MQKREQYKRLIMFLASAAIVVALTVIFSLVWHENFADNKEALIKLFWNRGNYVLVGLYALIVLLFLKVFGGLKVGMLRIYEVIYSQSLSVLCANAVMYLQLCLIGRWSFLEYVTPILYMTAFDLAVVFVWAFITRGVFVKLYPPRDLLLVYGEYDPNGLIKKLRSRRDKYSIKEVISCDEDIDVIREKIRTYDSVILADIPVAIRNKLLKFCFENDKRCYSIPKISDILIQGAENIHLFDTSLLLSRNKGLFVEQKFMKRFLDIVLSLIGIVIASPFMLVIALCIKLYDRGPVFFKQDRLTLNKKVFGVYKFRSMRVQPKNAEYQMTRKNDDRVTPVGKVIRALHLDELPQLFNILKGDMSFVGPRPETPQLAEEYCKIIPEFDFRLKVKAGLTGFAQVYGKYNTTPYDKLKLDLTYIQNYSLLLDLKLMLLTFKILFQKENTEGIESWQKSAMTKQNIEKLEKEDEK